MHRIAIKRIYDPASEDDGWRVLVDRLWPRGLSKQAAAIDHWAKEVAPSNELRKWYAHDPAKWDDFRQRYRAELAERRGAVDALRARADDAPLTLLVATKETARNHAVVLKEVLEAG